MFEAPTPLAPVNATTLSDWLTGAPKTEVTDCVLVTVTPVSAAGAVAVQISATPLCVAARCTRVQVRPAPDTVRVCVFVPVAGPSQAAAAGCRGAGVGPAPDGGGVWVFVPGGGPPGGAKATSTSPAALVENAGVVRGPVPSENTVLSTVGPVAAAGPSEITGATALPTAT